MINSQSKSLGLKDSSLTKTEANTQNSLNNTNDFDYRLTIRHVVDIYCRLQLTSKTRNAGRECVTMVATTACSLQAYFPANILRRAWQAWLGRPNRDELVLIPLILAGESCGNELVWKHHSKK